MKYPTSAKFLTANRAGVVSKDFDVGLEFDDSTQGLDDFGTVVLVFKHFQSRVKGNIPYILLSPITEESKWKREESTVK